MINKKLFILFFLLVFTTTLTYIVIANDFEPVPENPSTELTEIIEVDAKTEQDNPNIKDNLDGYVRSEIDCKTGKFHAYKEGEIDRDLYINCNDAKNDRELKDLMNLAINKEVEEYKAVRGTPIQVTQDIRLEKVRLKK